MKSPYLLALILCCFLAACDSSKKVSKSKDDGKIEVVFLHINDVYEIAPLEGGKVGGMARLATLRKTLKAKNRNTLTVHAGDFLNPSLIGTLKHNGERIRGRQMVETMNAVGVDLATFGNHEFDINMEDLQKRLNESEFSWTTANCLQVNGDKKTPFYVEKNGSKNFIPETYTYVAKDQDGTLIKVGIFAVTLPSNPQDWVHYEDFYEEAEKAYQFLSENTDVVIGLTHLEIDQDLELAKRLPNVPLLMGGHDHDNMIHQVGESTVAKADANVKSAYIHTLSFDHATKKATIHSELKVINESIPSDPEVQKVVDKWEVIMMDNIQELVEKPNEIIYQTTTPLDGRESSIRNRQTNLGQAITQSMLMASKNGAVCAIQNGGSVRIDDQISGDVTAVDIFRALPFGGAILDVELTGALLKEVLDYGQLKKGNGAYLQWGNILWDTPTAGWMIQQQPIDLEKNYKIMLNDYLILGYDIPFFKEENPGVLSVDRPDKESDDPRKDVRIALIDYLKTL